MNRKRTWVWVALFVLVVIVIGILATQWNVVLVRDYRKLLEVAGRANHPRAGIWFGTLGFAAALVGTILLFSKAFREMKLNQRQSEFLASVSHSLKTPIATLELSSALLQRSDLSSEERNKLWFSHDAELVRLKDEVHQLLESARWQSQPNLIENRVVLLDPWLKDALKRWAKILGPNSQLNHEGEPLKCEALIDLKALDMITDNLVENAKKFSIQSSPKLLIRSHLTSTRWRLEVKDFGLGFDPNDRDRIFKAFYRSKSEAPHAIAGTGLGLYLAAQASKKMGIQLSAESLGTGTGATFTLEGRRTS